MKVIKLIACMLSVSYIVSRGHIRNPKADAAYVIQHRTVRTHIRSDNLVSTFQSYRQLVALKLPVFRFFIHLINTSYNTISSTHLHAVTISSACMPCISQGGWRVFSGLRGLRGFRGLKGVEGVFESLGWLRGFRGFKGVEGFSKV